jgi:hypothetical protein
MRPKVVLTLFGIAFVLLGAIVLFKGAAGRNAGNANDPANGASRQADAGTNDTGKAQVVANSGNPPEVSAEMRAALVSKAIEQIQELQGEVDGTNNPVIIAALLDKVANPEPDVRVAALAALKDLNDTNAIAGLQKAADVIQDPRDKVTVMDVIDYLKLPNILQDVQSSDSATNNIDPSSVPRNLRMNPKFMHNIKKPDAAAATSQ